MQIEIDKNQQIELLEKVAEKLNDDLEEKSDNSQIISELKSELESLKSETWQFEKFQRNGRRFTYILAHILLLLVPIIQSSFQQKRLKKELKISSWNGLEMASNWFVVHES